MPKMPRKDLIAAPTSTTTTPSTAPANTSKTVTADSNAVAPGFVNGQTSLNKLNFTPTPNPLSGVYQPTYHFQFYLDTDIQDAKGKGNTVVIAESGITGMNIQDVQIEGWVGPNIRTRNANATSITIKIYEPYGATLPDVLYQAAAHLKISNYFKAPWYLSLRFMGYEEVGGTPIQVGELKTWALILGDIDSHISETGSIHTIQAIPMSEDALNNNYAVIPVTARGFGSTVGDIAKGVIKAMNANADLRYGTTTPRFLEYAIEDRPYQYDTQVGVSSPFDHKITLANPQGGDQGSSPDYDAQSGHFAPGTDIPTMVDMLFSNSETAVKQVRNSRELPPDSGSDDEKNVAAVSSVFHRVDSIVEYKQYHPLLNDYCKKITYIIKPYDTMRVLTSMGRAKNFDKEKDLNQKKAAFAVSRNFIHKEYDYIFTGKNTEVEKFDIQTNFNWTINFPMLQGYRNDTQTAKVNNNSKPQDQTLDQNALVNNVEATQQAAEDAAKTVENDRTNIATVGQAKLTADSQALLDADKAKKDALNAAKSNQGKVTKINQDALNSAASKTSSARSSLLGQPYYGIADDVTANANNNGSNGGTNTAGALNNAPSYLPVTVGQSAEEQNAQATTGTANHNTNVKSLFGALLNQMYGDFSNSLQELDLEIRGDPYWLGHGDLGDADFKDPSGPDTPNFYQGEHIFVFRFKLPQGYDDNTSSVVLGDKADSDVFTGFYAVSTVTNKFTEGKFTQVLHANRIPGWEIDNIINGNQGSVDEDVTYGAPTPAASSGGSATNKPAGASSSVPNPGAKSRGARNNNPGNLKDNKYTRGLPGYTGSDGTFAQFATYQDGVNAQTNLLASKYLAQPTTVTAVVDKYLGYPGSGENGTANRNNYISHVTASLGKSTVTAADASKLSQAMRQFETGDKNA